MNKPTALSLFSGIGGFDLGLERAGFDLIGQCEIDPFCNRVLASHWPGVTRYGDIREFTLTGARRPNLVCGGFPCQDLSVAGKRAGLDGSRSGLWFEFYRVLSDLRPAFCLIENVPGLLSSHGGRDFGIILTGLGKLWPAVGWAILDSQYFGVAQRRRRVYVIGCPTRAGIQQILSICESGDWHPPARQTAGKEVAKPLGASASGQRYDLDHETYIPDVDWALQERDSKGPDSDTKDGHLIVIQDARGVRDKAQNGIGIQESETMYTLDSVSQHAAYYGGGVRRLTPTECERLQGFPDGWTDINGAKDGPRYRALGNAVTVPVIEYLGRRLRAVMP